MSDAPEKNAAHGKPEAAHAEGGGHAHKSHGGGAHGGGGHEEAHEGAPEWLISFADNVALMMGFFVILLAMNMAKKTAGGIGGEGKMGGHPDQAVAMIDFALSVREAFNNPVSVDSKDPNEQAMVRRLLERMGKSDTRDPGLKGRNNEAQSIRPSEYHAICGSVAFSENSAIVADSSRQTAVDVAQKLRGLNLIVELRGHVSAAEAYHSDDRAMSLALQRALAVAHILAENGVDWWQMRLVACADNDRIEAFPSNKTNDSPNARVEIVVTDQIINDTVPTTPETAQSAQAWDGAPESH